MVEEIDEGNDVLLYYIMKNRDPKQLMKSDDFVMIQSRRPSREPR